MQGIEVYLKKFENLGLGEKKIKQKLIGVIKEVSGVDVTERQIDIVDGLVRISVTGPAKTEIFIRRNEIKEKIDEVLNIL